jgi:hypothetical protein
MLNLQPIDQLIPVDEKMDLEMIDELVLPTMLVGGFYDFCKILELKKNS